MGNYHFDPKAHKEWKRSLEMKIRLKRQREKRQLGLSR